MSHDKSWRRPHPAMATRRAAHRGTPSKSRYTPRDGALPRFVCDLLAGVPEAGQGVNLWLFRVARVLHRYRKADEIRAILRAATTGCGREVLDKEIIRAVERSAAHAGPPGSGHGMTYPSEPGATPANRTWPSLDQARRDGATASGNGLVDLWEKSRVRWEDCESHTEEIIDALFPGNPLLCVGASSSVFDTRPREAWRGQLGSLSLIVPSPMTAPTGLTQDNRKSAHTLANTGPRRFLVVEFDSGPPDEHAALHIHLGKVAPLVLVVHSGGKSLHGWYYCEGYTEERMREFMRRAVALGADAATWTRSQFVRMPDGCRQDGARQCVYYFTPEAMR